MRAKPERKRKFWKCSVGERIMLKVKLFLCLIKHHTMKACWGMQV